MLGLFSIRIRFLMVDSDHSNHVFLILLSLLTNYDIEVMSRPTLALCNLIYSKFSLSGQIRKEIKQKEKLNF